MATPKTDTQLRDNLDQIIKLKIDYHENKERLMVLFFNCSKEFISIFIKFLLIFLLLIKKRKLHLLTFLPVDQKLNEVFFSSTEKNRKYK